MMIAPIIPIPIMSIICIALLLLKRRGIFNYIKQIIIIILLFMINLRIIIPTQSTMEVQSNVDVLFVVDNTISMLAMDYNGSNRRIDAVKEDVNAIIDSFPNARFGLISFSNTAKYLVPYTYESDLIKQAVKAFEGHTKYIAGGTSLNLSYDVMENTLKRSNRYELDDDRIQLVFFISDGEITDDSHLTSFKELSKYVDTGAVLGYGTEEGGKMRVKDSVSDNLGEILEYYDKHYDKKVAISKIDEDNLESIADDMGIEYYHMTDHEMLKDVLEDINESMIEVTYSNKMEDKVGYDETYWMFAIALSVFLFIDFVYSRVKQAKER